MLCMYLLALSSQEVLTSKLFTRVTITGKVKKGRHRQLYKQKKGLDRIQSTDFSITVKSMKLDGATKSCESPTTPKGISYL